LLIHIQSQNHLNSFKSLKGKGNSQNEVEEAIKYLVNLKFRQKVDKKSEELLPDDQQETNGNEKARNLSAKNEKTSQK